MHGRASAPAAGTGINALATGRGAAFAIDRETTAVVELTDSTGIRAEIEDTPDGDTRLIERCVELVVAEYGDGQGAQVRTASEIPMAAGLKSSSAAANATVLATLDALGVAVEQGNEGVVSHEDTARLGVRAARDVGVTVTGAFDDASASMLGGLTVTDNTTDELLAREAVDWDVVVWTPDEQAFSAEADVERCRRVASMVEVAMDLALAGEYERAMTLNGLAYSAALDFPTEPVLAALPFVDGVSLSGTGPSYVAVGERAAVAKVQEAWNEYEGNTWLTRTRSDGAQTR